MAGFRWAFRASEASPFDCAACTGKEMEARNCHNGKGLGEEARAVSSYTNGVAEEIREAKAAKVISLGNLRLYECPLSYLTEETGAVMRLVFLIEDSGKLYCGGGWGDQPCWLVEAFEIYRTERGEFQKRLEKK